MVNDDFKMYYRNLIEISGRIIIKLFFFYLVLKM